MSSDMTGRPAREPGQRGERYREARERRARASRASKETYWAGRMEAAQTPLSAFKVAVDRLTTAIVQRERRADVACKRAARDHPGTRQEAAARTRLQQARKEMTADLVRVSEQLLEIAARHETHRA